MTIVPTATRQPHPDLPQKARTAKPCACLSSSVVSAQADAADPSNSCIKGTKTLTPSALPDPISP